jgi:von Willebrand factor A domain-containing protein 7
VPSESTDPAPKESGVRRVYAAFVVSLVALSFAPHEAHAQGTSQQAPSPAGTDARGLLRINQDFYILSAASGGDFYFWAPREFAASGLQIPIESEPILLAYGELAEGTRIFEFPVDTVSRRVSIVAGAQRKDRLHVIRPSGQPVIPGDPDAHIQEFKHMLVVTATKPDLGTWRIEFTGAGRFSLSVRAGRAPARMPGAPRPEIIEVIRFDFVERGGRPGHEGYFALKGRVRSGEERLCSAMLSGPHQSANFTFVSIAGEPLAPLNLTRGDPDIATNEFFGPCPVPAQPFRLRVTGRDMWGADYQRMHSPLYTPDAPR